MRALLLTALYVLDFYKWIVIAAVVSSWLVQYGVINRFNHFAMSIVSMLDRLTEPALRPIRRIIPAFSGIDISPIILFIIIYFLEMLISQDIMPFVVY